MDLISSFSSLQLWLISIITFLVAYNYLTKQPWRRLPPGPPALPLVGSLPFLGRDLRKSFLKMAAKYGDVLTIYLGLEPVIILNGLDTIKEAVVKKGEVFSNRPKNYAMETWSQGRGFAFVNGKKSQEQRQFTFQILKQFGTGRSIFEGRIMHEISFFLHELSKYSGQPLDPIPFLKMSLWNVVSSVTYGKRYDYGDVVIKRHLDISDFYFNEVVTSGLMNILPFIRYLPGDISGLKKLSLGVAELHCAIREAIEQHKLSYKEHQEPRDFIDAYLKKIDEDEDNQESAFSEEQLVGVVSDLFAGATETPSANLAWLIIYMTLNPHVQSRVQAEIDDVIDNDVDISMDLQSRLPFTVATIYETQRLGGASQFLPRASTEDTYLKGYYIPKGTTVLSNVNSVHMDPNTWCDPSHFKPERFMNDAVKPSKKDHILSFGSGKRECPGRDLARMELFLYFTSIMKNFKFSLAPGYPVPDTCGVLRLDYAPKPFHVMIEKRN